MSWKPLGTVPPRELVDARLQLHHAAQVVASVGVTFLPPQPDDSHPNLGWVEPLGALVGHPLPGDGAQVGLRVSDLSLLLVSGEGEIRDELDLDARKLDDAYAWVAEATTRDETGLPAKGITRAAYDIPDHPVGDGGVFARGSDAAFGELARWFANGHEVLARLAARTPGASSVRCWPHHFDLGTLVTLATDSQGNLARSIGLGLSPGDDGYSEPYWYVSPWPYPERDSLPSLASGGLWHTEGHTSVILTGSNLLEGAPGGQHERLRVFLDDSIGVCRRILAD